MHNNDWQWAYDLWQIPNVKAAIVTISLGIILDLVRRFIVPRGRIAWGISHNEHFILPADPNAINVRIRQIFVQNVGRAVAEDVEVTLNYPPQHWHVFPPLLQVMPSGQDRFLRLQTKMLNKREHFLLSIFDAQRDLPLVLTVRWKGGVAKQVPIVPRQKLPTWFERILILSMYFGILSALFLILRLAILIF